MIKYRNGNFLLTIDHYSVEILAHEAVIYDLETIFRRLFLQFLEVISSIFRSCSSS